MVRQLGLVLLILLPSATAGAHARIQSPIARNTFDDVKEGSTLRPPPCGGPRSTVVLSKQVGDVIEVEWDETIDHSGHYEILFSMGNDQNFVHLNDPNGAILNNIPDIQGGTLPRRYKQMVKLPSTPCAACTLQMKQFMTGDGFYFSCADVELRAAPVVIPGVDGGTPAELPDLAAAPQAQPTPSTEPEPSTAPEQPAAPGEMPDMAATKLDKRSIPPTEYDYSFGCSVGATAATSGLPILFVISALGIARICSRSRSRSRA